MASLASRILISRDTPHKQSLAGRLRLANVIAPSTFYIREGETFRRVTFLKRTDSGFVEVSLTSL